MKRIIAVLFCLSIAFCSMAQHRPQGKDMNPAKGALCVESMVSDLSSIQKKRLEAVANESKQSLDKIDTDLRQLRDSIRTYLSKDGDYSKVLYPLYDREARLEALRSKEMYSARLKIDKILTAEQLVEFRKKLEASRRQGHKHGPAPQHKPATPKK